MSRVHDTIICFLGSLGVALLVISLVLVPQNLRADDPGGGVGGEVPPGCSLETCDSGCDDISHLDCPGAEESTECNGDTLNRCGACNCPPESGTDHCHCRAGNP